MKSRAVVARTTAPVSVTPTLRRRLPASHVLRVKLRLNDARDLKISAGPCAEAATVDEGCAMIRVRSLGQCVIEVGDACLSPESEVVFAMLLYLATHAGRP